MTLTEHWRGIRVIVKKKKKVVKKKGKPTARYGTLVFCRVGHSALVYRVWNHPTPHVVGSGYVRTSRVVNIVSPDKFETENTVYVARKGYKREKL